MQGLRDTVVARTNISGVDGEAGTLVIRGRSVGDGPPLDFESAMHWALAGAPPTDGERAATRRGLAAGRVGAPATPVRSADVMSHLRAGVGSLEVGDDVGPGTIVGAVATLTAEWWATQRGVPLPSPDPAAGHAADLLRMLGVPASPPRVAALDSYLSTVIDHGLNASTFAARVVASTGSDTVSAVTAAIGALKGPLHGGAPGPVLDMLDAVRGADATARLEAELDAGRPIMGMGHRVYRVRDPRAAALEAATEALARTGAPSRLDEARALERTARDVLERRKPGRRIAANVEFFTAVLLDALGLDRRLFPALFACSRVVGWLAHIHEQRGVGRLIRPRSEYIGPAAPVGPARSAP